MEISNIEVNFSDGAKVEFAGHSVNVWPAPGKSSDDYVKVALDMLYPANQNQAELLPPSILEAEHLMC